MIKKGETFSQVKNKFTELIIDSSYTVEKLKILEKIKLTLVKISRLYY